MIKAIIFDVGNVIVYPDWKTVNKLMLENKGISVFLDEEFSEMYKNDVMIGKKTAKDLFQLIIEKKNLDADFNDVEKFYFDLYEEYSKISSDTIKLVDDLRKKIKVCILSNMNELHKRVNEKRDLFEHFDKTFLSCDIGLRKPNEDIFKFILKELNIESKNIIYIDDDEDCINMASKLGINGIQFKNLEQLKEELIKLGVKV